MFAIYNTYGRAFRDNLEALKKIHQPNSSAKTQLQQDVGQDETIVIQGSESPPSQNASQAETYRKMLHVNERQVIVHAHQIMTHPVMTLQTTVPVEKAYQEFMHYHLNQFPVLTPQLQIVGLVTRLAVTQALMDSPQAQLGDLIKQDIITADPVTDIRRVAKVMIDYELSALPVVNAEDTLVGIISKTDMVKALLKDPPLSLWT